MKFNDSTTYDFNKLQAKFKNGFKSLSLTGKVGSISVSSLLTLSQAMDFRAPVDTKAKSSTITLVVDKQRYLGRYGQSAVIDFDEKQAKLIAAENVAPPTQVLHFNLYGYEGAGNYEVYLTLGDKAGNAVAANGKIAISILDSDNAVLYSGTKSIKKSDFQQITWIDSGESLIGYTWTFPASLVKKGIGIGSAKVMFSTSDGKSISATYDSVYIPALDGEELAQALEERYLKSAIELNQTVEKSGLKITAARVGDYKIHSKVPLLVTPCIIFKMFKLANPDCRYL